MKQRILLDALAARPRDVVTTDELIALLWPHQPPRHAKRALRTLVSRARQTLDDPELLKTAVDGYLLNIPPAPAKMFQLPAELRAFVGREEHVERLAELLDTHEVVTVTGPPGAGKTTLAVVVAQRVRERFPDGQLYVNLRGYDTNPPVPSTEVLARFLRALGVPPDDVPLDEAAQSALFRKLLTGRRVLVVLDNASADDQIAPLLPEQHGCAVLVTSRNALRTPAALPVGMLSEEESAKLVTNVIGAHRVEQEREACAELVELCGRLPLALCIAAANIEPHESVAEHVARLRDPLPALEIDGDDQFVVRTAFDLSYRRLCPDEQLLFRRLGLVPGPDFTEPVATALANEPAGKALAALESAHLVERTGDRYRLHDLLRRYAREQCTEADDEARQHMIDFMVLAANDAADAIHPGRLAQPLPGRASLPVVRFADRADATDWLDAELHNLMALVHETARRGPVDAPTQIVTALHGLLASRRHVVEWFDVCRTALDAAERAGDAAARGRVHLLLSETHASRCEHEQTAEHLDAAERLADDVIGVGVRYVRGRLYLSTGRLREARECYTACVDAAKQVGYGHGAVLSLTRLGDIHWELGELSRARETHTEAVRRAENHNAMHFAMSRLGPSVQALGRLDEAVEHYRTGIAMLRELGEAGEEASTLTSLAGAYRDLGRFDDALTTANEALKIATRTGSLRSQAGAHHVIGSTSLLLGRCDEAQEALRTALRLATRAGHPRGRGDALVSLAEATGDSGHARQALSLSRETGHALIEGEAMHVLASLTKDADLAEEAAALHRRTGYRLGLERAENLLATLRAANRMDRGEGVAGRP